MIDLRNGDCLEVLRALDDNSVDAVVTDPPYGLSFMGKKWDYDVPSVEVWRECLRVLKPGGHLLSFAGTRTQHRMACNIEDAGFEIRDMIAWIYASGFPKSLNIGKAVDKLQGNEREDLGYKKLNPRDKKVYAPKSESAFTLGQKEKGIEAQKLTKGTSEWEGWGTALKPALEPITVARKPLGEKTVAENCLKWGVGGINIDASRVRGEYKWRASDSKIDGDIFKQGSFGEKPNELGRFPANLIHDGSDEVVGLFPQTKGEIGRVGRKSGGNYSASSFKVGVVTETGIRDSGSASRFFYCAKASKKERNRGCEGLEEKLKSGTEFRPSYLERFEETGDKGSPRARFGKTQNNHPTVKPIALMEYLVKLVSREGQTVLDPFAGSGTTGIACKNLNRNAILIEREAEYIEIAKCRMAV